MAKIYGQINLLGLLDIWYEYVIIAIIIFELTPEIIPQSLLALHKNCHKLIAYFGGVFAPI